MNAKPDIFMKVHGVEQVNAENALIDLEVLVVSEKEVLPYQDIVVSMNDKNHQFATGANGKARIQLIFPFDSAIMQKLQAAILDKQISCFYDIFISDKNTNSSNKDSYDENPNKDSKETMLIQTVIYDTINILDAINERYAEEKKTKSENPVQKATYEGEEYLLDPIWNQEVINFGASMISYKNTLLKFEQSNNLIGIFSTIESFLDKLNNSYEILGNHFFIDMNPFWNKWKPFIDENRDKYLNWER